MVVKKGKEREKRKWKGKRERKQVKEREKQRKRRGTRKRKDRKVFNMTRMASFKCKGLSILNIGLSIKNFVSWNLNFV